MTNSLRPRSHIRSYGEDPALCDRVFALLDTWIPTLSRERRNALTLRGRWEDCSTPFVVERDGQVISHVGVLDTRVVCGDRGIPTAGVHAVCTREDFRRQGLYRGIMEEVLASCDERYPLVKLSTAHPEYYEPFGFRVIPEHRFRLSVDTPGGRAGFRALDRNDDEDLDLLDDLLTRRAPVSGVLGAAGDGQVFKFNASNEPLHYCEELDLLAIMTLEGESLTVDDLVCAAYPSVQDLAAQIPSPISEVVFHFRPDLLGAGEEATPEPYRYDGDVLMVRGELPEDGKSPRELMLSPLARH